jgi:hypothetical protein
MRIFATISSLVLLGGQGQAGVIPGIDATSEIEYLLETCLAQRGAGGRRAVATGAADDYRLRLEFLDFRKALAELIQGNVPGIDDVTGSRTSMTIASSRLTISVACIGETLAPPNPPENSGHSNMPPLATARPTQMMFA